MMGLRSDSDIFTTMGEYYEASSFFLGKVERNHSPRKKQSRRIFSSFRGNKAYWVAEVRGKIQNFSEGIFTFDNANSILFPN